MVVCLQTGDVQTSRWGLNHEQTDSLSVLGHNNWVVFSDVSCLRHHGSSTCFGFLLPRKQTYLTYFKRSFIVWRTCVSRGRIVRTNSEQKKQKVWPLTCSSTLTPVGWLGTMSEQWSASWQRVLISVTSVWPPTSVFPAGWAAAISSWLKDTAINEWFRDSRRFLLYWDQLWLTP